MIECAGNSHSSLFWTSLLYILFCSAACQGNPSWQAENKIRGSDSVGQLCDRVSSASHFFHSRPVWLFSFESCVYWFPLVIVSVGTGADSFFAAGMPWKHWQPLPEWICPGMQMLSVMPDQSSAGMPPMSFLIKKGTGFQANPGMFAVLSVTNAITHPHF